MMHNTYYELVASTYAYAYIMEVWIPARVYTTRRIYELVRGILDLRVVVSVEIDINFWKKFQFVLRLVLKPKLNYPSTLI